MERKEGAPVDDSQALVIRNDIYSNITKKMESP